MIYKIFYRFRNHTKKSANCSLVAYYPIKALVNHFLLISANSSRFLGVNFCSSILGETY